MSKSKYPKILYSIICEDIRHETGNKSSLMGVFHKNIHTPIPYMFPKLCFRIVFDGMPDSETLEARLYDPYGNVLQKARIDLPIKPNGDVSMFTIDLAFSGIQIENEGRYSLAISFDKDKSKQKVGFFVVEAKNRSD